MGGPTDRDLERLGAREDDLLEISTAHAHILGVAKAAADLKPGVVSMAHAFGARTAFIEVFDRIETPTLTGRLVRPFTDLMLVQWPEQTALYNNAIAVGPLL